VAHYGHGLLPSTLEVSLTSGDQHASCRDWRASSQRRERSPCSSNISHPTYLGKVNKGVLVTRDFWPGDASPNLSICCYVEESQPSRRREQKTSQPQARGDDDTGGVVRVGPRYGTGLSVNGRQARKMVCFALLCLTLGGT
jgi:hypothetical protein